MGGTENISTLLRILAFRHVPFEHLGLIADVLTGRGIAFEYVDLDKTPDACLDIGSADGFVFMGGPMSANDDFPFIRRELAFIQQAVSAGKPILGVCLGSQLIARALGSRIYRNAAKEIGWAPVSWTEAAARDHLFSGLNGPETLFHWHGETFDLPPKSELLAYSDGCRNQAFRVGSNVYGLQFHLEVTPEMISTWCEEDANSGDVCELTEPIDPNQNAPHMRELAASVFGRWCDLLR